MRAPVPAAAADHQIAAQTVNNPIAEVTNTLALPLSAVGGALKLL